VNGIGGLSYARVTFSLLPEREARLPAYLGSTLRGALGHALRTLVDDAARTAADRRVLGDACPYLCLFGDPALDELRGARDTARPFVLRPPLDGTELRTPDRELRFGIVLVGRAQLHLPWIAFALDRAAKHGLGVDRAPFRLAGATSPDEATWAWSPGQPLELPPERTGDDLLRPVLHERVVLRLVTPLRLYSNGSLLMRPSFVEIASACLRRLHPLLREHCDASLALDTQALLEAAQAVEIQLVGVRRTHIDRYSSRQGRRLSLEGLIGELHLAGPTLPLFGPLLRAVEVLSLGKSATLGFGQIEIDAASA